jgi:predicted RNA-binding Zn-ribbon protein involved in translation (DUF1610 family)
VADDSTGPEKSLFICPHCGKSDSLEFKRDAWAVFSILGLSTTQELVLSKDFETQLFDDYHIQCGSCGERLTESSVISLMQELK